VDANLTTPYIQNCFLGIQRQVLNGTVVELNYIGSAGHHLFNSIT
jgi:hypothetical protein